MLIVKHGWVYREGCKTVYIAVYVSIVVVFVINSWETISADFAYSIGRRMWHYGACSTFSSRFIDKTLRNLRWTTTIPRLELDTVCVEWVCSVYVCEHATHSEYKMSFLNMSSHYMTRFKPGICFIFKESIVFELQLRVQLVCMASQI